MTARRAHYRSPVTRLTAKVTAAAVVTLAIGAAAAALGTSPASASSTVNWITTSWSIHLNYQSDPATTSHFFNTPGSYGLGNSPGTSPVLDNFAASGVMTYTSYAQFASDIASNAIAPSYKWVLYDPEMWAQTPLNEQKNPQLYMRLFGQLAHAHGLKVIEAPARDLGLVSGSVCPQLSVDNLDSWYIRCGIAKAAAGSSDVYVLQDQVNTTNVSEYDNLYTQARAQALAANPQVAVDSEVSTNYGTASQMVTAAESIPADGFYLSVTQASLGQADQFLKTMQAAGY
jgi:hypothetical protein